MFTKIAKFFAGPSTAESYANGRKTADKLLAEGAARGREPSLTAEHIFAMGFGCRQDTEADRAFDRGIQDRLCELGFESPY